MFCRTMIRGFLAAALVASAVALAQADQITIATVPVGNAGNTGELSGTGAGGHGTDRICGAVSYNYSIGKTDVTNDQYAAFLTAKAASSDPYGLWSSYMESNGCGGIIRTGSGPYTYAVKSGQGNQPVTCVSWYDTLRFANWLTNGQGNGDTENGSYTLLGGTATPSNAWFITRSAGAKWVLPSEDEWYKAAYYKGGGLSAGYWDYPTSSNTAPTAQAPPGGSNSANFYNSATGYLLTNSRSYNSAIDYLTNAGAYSSSLSPYGTLDQCGNVWQWNEANFSGSGRGLRGGSFYVSSYYLASFARASPTAPRTSTTFSVSVLQVCLSPAV
ncbi:MAG: SUMF1/EgtB/PvdO family nonheme iron enzyme [Planctomycetota bacterium]